ncbi:hypothetical protein HGG75_17575 [Ochrobactrum pseudogrignonense]|nr:hypothetical protein [Brucella pseudogrignonensis]
MARVFKGRVKNWGNLDYVTLWFAKARDYSLATGAPFAFVATNSIVQGVQVPELWPHLLENLEIRFAHRSFKWSNGSPQCGRDLRDYRHGAAQQRAQAPVRWRYRARRRGDRSLSRAGTTAIVEKASRPLAPDLEPMVFGNKPTDGGNLILDRNERDALLEVHPDAARFVRRLYGSQELMKGIERYCLWVGTTRSRRQSPSQNWHDDSRPWHGIGPRKRRRTFRRRLRIDLIASCKGRALRHHTRSWYHDLQVRTAFICPSM